MEAERGMNRFSLKDPEQPCQHLYFEFLAFRALREQIHFVLSHQIWKFVTATLGSMHCVSSPPVFYYTLKVALKARPYKKKKKKRLAIPQRVGN